MTPSIPGHPTLDHATLPVTFRLLRKFLPGETRSVLAGLCFVLAGSAAALLQPWPLKLVLDCVIGHDRLPGFFVRAFNGVGLGGVASVDSKLGLLLLLCLSLLLIELLLGGFN